MSSRDLVFHGIFVYLMTTSFGAHAETIQWVAQSPNNNMNTPTNWNPNTVPGSTDDAVFDSTLPGVDVTPTDNSTSFSVLTFQFPNTASLFDFNFNNQTLTFQGIGITGALTNPTINISNINNSSFLGNLLSFQGPTATSGSANITSFNSAMLIGSVSNTGLSNITSHFFSNGPFTITGNGTINVSNVGNDSASGTGNNGIANAGSSQLGFAGSFTAGNNVTVTASNSGTFSGNNTSQGDGVSIINGSQFTSSGAFQVGDNFSCDVQNTGNDSSHGVGLNNVGVVNSAQMLLQSTGTVSNNCNITVSNTGINSSQTTTSSDVVGYLNDQQFFVGNIFQAGDAFNLTVTNTGTDSSSGIGGSQVAVINSNSGTTGNQILFQQGCTIGDNATITTTNTGTYSGTNTSIGPTMAIMNLQQVVFGNNTAPGSYSFNAGDNFSMNVSTVGIDNGHGMGSDVVGAVSSDQITLYTPCSLGNNATITVSGSGNFSGNATSTLVDVGSIGGSQLNCVSTFQAKDNFILNVTNLGTSSGSGSGDNFIGDLIDGQQVAFNGGILVENNANINISNSGSNSSSTTNLNQIGSLMGYGKQLFVQEQFQTGDNLQIVITNSGFDDSTAAGGNYVGFINNNTGDQTASQLHLSRGGTVGNNASILLSNTGTYQGSNAGSNRTALLSGQQFFSVTEFQAGDNFNLTASNLGTNSGSGQNNNTIGAINGNSQINFGNLCTLGNNASFVLSNTGINHDTTGTSNSIGVVNGTQLDVAGNFTAGTNLNMEISNVSTNTGNSNNIIGFINGSQLSFQQNCTLSDGSNMIVSNSGTVVGSQILFSQGFDVISGQVVIQTINTGTVNLFGIDVQGNNAGGNAHIVLGNSSLNVETTLPTFTIGGLDGDAMSLVQSQPTLIINTNASTQADFTGTIQDFTAISSTLIKTGDGTQTLSGANTYTGETTIQGGILILTGSLAGEVLIDSSAILKGTGTINSTLINTGTVSPGQSIGTLTVDNYINNGGTYDVEINGQGQSDLIYVTETATLNGGTILINLIGNTFSFQKPYTIVTANGGVTGTYTGASSSAFINPILTYDPNNVYLTIEAALVKAAKTCNQYGVAQTLDSIINPNAGQTLLISTIATLPLKEAQYALESLSGFQYTNEVWVTNNSTKRFLRRLYDPLRSLMISCYENPSCEQSAWLETGYGFATSEGNNAHSTLVNSYQVTGGIQKNLPSGLTLGFASSYEHDHINYRNAKEHRNSGFVSAYGLYKPCMFYELFDIVCGFDSGYLNRSIKVGGLRYKATSKPKLTTIALYDEIGCDLYTEYFLFQPFLGFQFSNTWRKRINEKQANGWGLTLNKHNWSSNSARLGLHISNQYCRERLNLSLDLAWNTLLSSHTTSTKGRFTNFGNTFTICGNTLDIYSIDYALTLFIPLCKELIGYLVLSGESWQHANTFDFTVGFKSNW